MMTKKLTIKYEEGDDPEWEPHRYEGLYDGDKELYSASDLSECPEDANLARDIMDAEGAIDLIKYGMALRYKGYSDIQVEYEKEDW